MLRVLWLSLLLPSLLGACASAQPATVRAANSQSWRFELKGSPALLSVADVDEIRRQVYSQAYNRTQIVQLVVNSADEVWVRRGRKYGGVAELWKRDGATWQRGTPEGLNRGWTVGWSRSSEE